MRAWVIRRLTGRLTAAFASTVIVLGLLALGWGIHRTQLALTPISALGSGTGPAKGAHAAEAGFAGGIVSPSEVVLRRPGITNDGARLAALSLRMGRVDGVAAAVGAGDASVVGLRRVFRAPGADAVRYLVVLDHGPYGAPAIDDLQNLQRRLPHLLASVGLGGAKISYAGDTAIAEQTVQRIRHDIEWVAIAAFAVNFVLLALFLRALLAPFLLILASALALAATFGITTWLFQSFLGYAQLTYYVPLAVGVLLLSFGSDYNLFVVGRIWQESRFESVEQAIRSVAPRTSRAVSVAGLALAGSFAALAIVPLKPFYEFAFAMSVGVLIDTFVVRSYLIPAMLALFGRVVWWPSRRGGESRRRA
jgi:RND superfamily putative drug exporter